MSSLRRICILAAAAVFALGLSLAAGAPAVAAMKAGGGSCDWVDGGCAGPQNHRPAAPAADCPVLCAGVVAIPAGAPGGVAEPVAYPVAYVLVRPALPIGIATAPEPLPPRSSVLL